MKTVLYARYSTDLQNPRSCEDQIALLTDRCSKEGWEIVGVYSDESVRGGAGLSQDARPGMHKLLAHIQLGGVGQVVAEHSSRLARDQRDMLEIFELARFYGARLFTIADGELSSITASIKGLMDASQSKAIADHVKRGQRAAIMDGRCPGGIAYGYRIANTIGQNGRAIRGLRVIDDEQAAIILRIFKEYAANESPKRIAERLNADGIPGPRGRVWKASTIYGDEKRKNGILQNRLYIGQLVLNRTSKALHPIERKERIRPNPESAWIIKDKPELRIVPDELWSAVKDRRAQSVAKPFRLQRRPKRLLSGLGTCAVCGGPWIVIGDERWGAPTGRMAMAAQTIGPLRRSSMRNGSWVAFRKRCLIRRWSVPL
jgi:DNA invertase Pin-like site-specific DNA recombinase